MIFDMEMILRVAALCVAAAVLVLTVRRGSPELALLLSLAAVTVVLLAVGSAIGELTAFLKKLEQYSGISGDLFLPLYKTVGIALVVKAGGSLCRDAGESALAATLELAGTVCALLVSLPLLRTVLELLLEFMK